MTSVTQRDLLQAARHPAARGSAAELLPGALQAEGMVRLERMLLELARRAPGELRGATVDLIAAGGKRVRPLLTLLSARAAGRARGARARGPGRIALALSAELVHSATLLHDDVIDDGLTRRGLPAPRVAYGNSVSVLSGDWMLTSALDLALRSRVPGAVPALVRTLRELVAGEGRQLALRGDANFSAADARWIARMKTGSLFGYCAEAGGLAARAPDSITEALREFGIACGTAFQISDDLLDFQSDAATLGKAVLADVAEGKASVPLALALEETPSLRAELRGLLSEQLAPAHESPQALPHESPQELPQALPHDLPQELPQALPHDLPQELPDGSRRDAAQLGPLLHARLRAFATRMAKTPALAVARALAEEERDRALAALEHLPESPTRALLGRVAALLLERTS